MPSVVVQPSGISFDAEPGEVLIRAAWRHGLYWPTTCNGEGSCRTCLTMVLEGGDNVSEPERFETDTLGNLRFSLRGDPASYRLACQTRVLGDVVVRKAGVGPVTR